MKVVTIGGAMVDSIALIDNRRIERMTMRNAESSFLLLEEGRKHGLATDAASLLKGSTPPGQPTSEPQHTATRPYTMTLSALFKVYPLCPPCGCIIWRCAKNVFPF